MSELTNEAIEVHLSYLRTGLEAVQTELPKLREKMETQDEKLTGKIDALDERLSTAIKSGDERLATRIDKLGEKVDNLTAVVLKNQGSLEGLKWFIASATIIASGISIARSLGWF